MKIVIGDNTIPVLDLLLHESPAPDILVPCYGGPIRQARTHKNFAVQVAADHAPLLKGRFTIGDEQGMQFAEVIGNPEPGLVPGTLAIPIRLCGSA